LPPHIANGDEAMRWNYEESLRDTGANWVVGSVREVTAEGLRSFNLL